MHILICVQNYYPALAFGGRVVKSIALAEELARQGHEIEILTTTVMNGESQPARQGYSKVHHKVNVHYLGTLWQYRTASLNPGVIYFAIRQLKRFDVIHIMGMYESIGAAIAMFAGRWKIPYVLEPSGMLVPILRSFHKKNIYHRLVGYRMALRAAYVLATSEQEAAGIETSGVAPDRIVLRRNGVNLQEFSNLPKRGALRARLGIAQDVPIFLFVGRVNPIKKLEHLIEAFAQLERQDSYLVIVGPVEGNDYRQFLDDLIFARGIVKRVQFTGPLFGSEKLEAFVDADQFIMPSASESWGNAIVEAIAAGIPVIVTDTCGVARYVRDRVGLVVSTNVEALQNAMERLLTDISLYRSFKANTVSLAQELSWEKPIEQMTHLYESIARVSDK